MYITAGMTGKPEMGIPKEIQARNLPNLKGAGLTVFVYIYSKCSEVNFK